MKTEPKLTLKLDRARFYVLRASPFWGSLVARLADKIDLPDGATAQTDGRSIRWSASFLATLTEPETRFVLLHETCHCAFGHFWRMNPRDPLAQQAADYAVNLTLADSRLEVKAPAGALLDQRWQGKAEEEILAALRREAAGKPPQPSQSFPGGAPDPGKCGAFSDAPADEADDKAGDKAGDKAASKAGDESGTGKPLLSARQSWEQAVVNAVQVAQLPSNGKGDVPGAFARLAEAATAPPRVDWRQETADFARTATAATRNDWTRSPGRHAWQRVIYPRRAQRDVGLIVAVRDTSGSIGGADLAAFNAALVDCQSELGCELLLIDADSRIARELRVAPGGELPADAHGGGGTDFRPVFARCAELEEAGEAIAGIVYLTDLWGTEPSPAEVRWPTLWLCTTSRVASSGRTVRLCE